ncbi:MAG: hypothetical protein HZA00_06400, partial [Nitrospinae bacterium]|nr:hypothetical protein [Nitrospinota bacterium]
MEIKLLKMRDKNLINYRGKNRIKPFKLFKPFKPLLKSMCPLWLIIPFILIQNGCGTAPKQYIRANVNFQYIKKVAVLPLNNLTDDKYAGEKLKSIIVM